MEKMMRSHKTLWQLVMQNQEKILCAFSLGLWFCILPFLAGMCPIAQFVEEGITLDVYPEYVIMTGWYRYRNPFPFPILQGLTIPLPVDAEHPFPVSLAAKQLSPESASIPLRYVWGAYRFDLRFSAKEEIVVQVQYRQQASVDHAQYILTSTQPWRSPLRSAHYQLIPHDVMIISSNYPLIQDTSGVLRFSRQQFMPVMNWRFAWIPTVSSHS